MPKHRLWVLVCTQSNVYTLSLFWSKKKNRITPANPSFSIIIVGYKRIYFSMTRFPDELSIRLVGRRGENDNIIGGSMKERRERVQEEKREEGKRERQFPCPTPTPPN